MKKNFFNFSLIVLFLGLSLNSVNAMRGFGNGVLGKLQEKIYGWGLNRALSGSLSEKVRVIFEKNNGKREIIIIEKSVAEGIELINDTINFNNKYTRQNPLTITFKEDEKGDSIKKIKLGTLKKILSLEELANKLEEDGKTEGFIVEKLSEKINTSFLCGGDIAYLISTASYLGAKRSKKILVRVMLKKCGFKSFDVDDFDNKNAFKNKIANLISKLGIDLLNNLEYNSDLDEFRFNGNPVFYFDSDIVKRDMSLCSPNFFGSCYTRFPIYIPAISTVISLISSFVDVYRNKIVVKLKKYLINVGLRGIFLSSDKQLGLLSLLASDIPIIRLVIASLFLAISKTIFEFEDKKLFSKKMISVHDEMNGC